MTANDSDLRPAVESAVPSWRGGFGRLWSAAVVSRLGDGLRTAALPLLAVGLTDSPLLVSLVTAAGFLPWILFGLLGGAIADRVDQRRAMWAVDAVRCALMACFALAVWLDEVSIALLLVPAFVLTTLQTLFDNAATALLPTVVPTASLGRANARLMTGQTIAGTFLGAPLVPLLIGLSAGLPFAVDAATYLLAAALVASIRTAPRERAPRPPGRTLRQDIAEGIRVLWRDRVLRSLCTANTVVNIGMGALIATLVLHVTGWLHAGHSGYAAVLTAYGAGSVAGGLAAGRISELLGRTRALVAGLVLQSCALIVLGTVRSLPVAVVVLALFGAMGMLWNVNEVTLMQERTPAALLGRVSAANRTLSTAGAPLGALLGGAVATAWGLNTPALAAAALFACGVIALLPAVIN
ncbi:MFS transporter [Streptomyces sp. So13.3]|uniref:MFS transporter n=1 Tax=Streptomyces sp. So13.3 TaxID=2136173 RepID=UPI001FD464BF|nr:MFS transporter [Streptomyces sp. So13.3]